MKGWVVLYGLVIVAIVVLADTQRLGIIGRLYEFPGADKVGHFVLYGVLSLLVNLVTLERWKRLGVWRVALLTSALLAALIGLEELSQNLFPARTSSWADLAAGYLGVALFAGVAVWIRLKRRVAQGA